MFTKFIALTLVLLIADIGCAATLNTQAKETPAQVQKQSLSKKEIKRAAKVKKFIKELGVGPNARTEIRYAGGTKLKGYVSESADDYFVTTDETTGAATRVEYAHVEKVIVWPSVKTLMRRDLHSPSRLVKKLAIGAGIGFSVFLAVCAISKQCQN